MTYTRCQYPSCKRKGEAHYQAVGVEPGIIGETFDLCIMHLCNGEKSILRRLSKEATRTKFRKAGAESQISKKDPEVQKAIKDNKVSLTLDSYLETTGKRFRMTKAQKSRNISREDAFNEFMTGV